MPVVFLHCHRHRDWIVQFLEADLKTPVRAGKFYYYRTLDPVRRIITRGGASLQAIMDFDRDVRRWGVGTAWLNLSDNQYAKLRL